jgi:hypothetical protein
METDELIHEMRVDVPLGEDPQHDLLMAYLLTRLQYAPDGQWIHYCVGGAAMAVNPVANQRRVCAVPARLTALSEDGKILATLSTDTALPVSDERAAIGFHWTDGSRSIHVNLADAPATLGGLTWLDKRTVGLLTADDENDLFMLQRVRTDGTVGKTTTLALPEKIKVDDKETTQLAVSPNGKCLVLARGPDVFFMRTDGRLVGQWEGSDEEILAQPTFTPDSKRVAFKYMREKKDAGARVESIVFFTPQGEEESRVKLPPLKTGATQSSEK